MCLQRLSRVTDPLERQCFQPSKTMSSLRRNCDAVSYAQPRLQSLEPSFFRYSINETYLLSSTMKFSYWEQILNFSCNPFHWTHKCVLSVNPESVLTLKCWADLTYANQMWKNKVNLQWSTEWSYFQDYFLQVLMWSAIKNRRPSAQASMSGYSSATSNILLRVYVILYHKINNLVKYF